MNTLFDDADCAGLVARIDALRVDSQRQWGKMDVAQMLAHVSLALETGSGDRPMKQRLIGRIVAPLVRSSVLGAKPFGKNSPTDPTFVVADAREFAAERARLLALIERFAQGGPAGAGRYTHPFFGKITGDEWGRLMYKHIDHHLQQFAA